MRFRRALPCTIALVTAATCGALVESATAAPAPTAASTATDHGRSGTHHPNARLAHALGAQHRRDVVVRRGPDGAAQFVGTTARHPLATPSSVSASTPAAAAAQAFVQAHSSLFGLHGRAVDVRPTSTDRLPGGGTVARLSEHLHGHPVFGGEVVVDLTRDNRVAMASARTLPSTRIPAHPAVAANAARATALTVTARDERIDRRALHANHPDVVVTSLPLIGDPGTDSGPHLSYRVDVRGVDGVDELVLVDATTGVVLFNANQVEYGDAVDVCNAAPRSGRPVVNDPTCPPTGRHRQPTLMTNRQISADGDATAAKQFADGTYRFYRDVIGHATALGLPRSGTDHLNSTVHMCDPFRSTKRTCRVMRNAFWDGKEMVYGNGTPHADDVVAHELTHSVTEHTSNLFYWYQSGAINESMSDVIGELYDQWNGVGRDSNRYRWVLGENLPDSIGILRDMAHPTTPSPKVAGLNYQHFTPQPDRMTSPYYQNRQLPDYRTGHTYPKDAGGVHFNSGVGNKAAYLIVDGTGTKAFNHVHIAGLGGRSSDPAVRNRAIRKAAQIYYRADTLLPSAADYADLYNVLPQACNDLVGANNSMVRTVDCQSVQDAVDATEMNVPPPKATSPVATTCTGSSTLWKDTFERPALNHNWLNSSRRLGPWYYPASKNIYGNMPMVYATSGKNEAWGDDPDPKYIQAVGGFKVPTSGTLSMRHWVALPAGSNAHATFAHAYSFDWAKGFNKRFYDGGTVEYRTKQSGIVSAWKDAGTLLGPATTTGYNPDGGYNAILKGAAGAYSLPGFGGDSYGYGRSQLDLSPLAGKSVEIRFHLHADRAVGAMGWFVDDVRFFTCP